MNLLQNISETFSTKIRTQDQLMLLLKHWHIFIKSTSLKLANFFSIESLEKNNINIKSPIDQRNQTQLT